MNSPALNPCKKCGSGGIIHRQAMLKIEDHEFEFVVCCEICTQKGEWKRDRVDAIASWNELNKVRS